MKIVLIYVGAYYDYCALVEIHNNLDKCDDDRDRVAVVLVLVLLVAVRRDNGHGVRWKGVDEMDDADEAEAAGLLFEQAVEGNDSHRPLNAVAVGVV